MYSEIHLRMPIHDAFWWLIFRLTIGVEWSNVAELVDTDILSEAITFIQLETSIGVFVSPLLGGTISDRTGDYSYVFYIAGILLLSGEPLEARDPRTASVQSTFCGSKMDAVVVDQIFELGFRDGPWTGLLPHFWIKISCSYGVYPIIKQKVCERDWSREWICMKTLK